MAGWGDELGDGRRPAPLYRVARPQTPPGTDRRRDPTGHSGALATPRPAGRRASPVEPPIGASTGCSAYRATVSGRASTRSPARTRTT